MVIRIGTWSSNRYTNQDNEKKRLYSRRVLDIEHGTFAPLIFTSTGGMGKKCLQYNSRLAQLISIKKGEDYAKTISWIRPRTSFALLRSALICLRGSRARRKAFYAYALVKTGRNSLVRPRPLFEKKEISKFCRQLIALQAFQDIENA